MTIQRIPVTDREQWLTLRKQDVTASAVAALFGAHPYETPLGLWLEKTGSPKPDIDNAVLRRGRLLEDAVAMAVAEQRPDWQIEKAAHYFRDPDLRMGATPDFFIHGDPRGLGVLQTKTVAPNEFRRKCADDTVPFWITLQTLQEAMLTEAKFAVVAALVIDPYKLPCPIFELPRHAGAEARIREAISDFWDSVKFGKPPEPDFARDGALLDAISPAPIETKVIDLSGDNHLPVLLDERAELKSQVSKAAERIEAIDAEVKFKMGEAGIARIDGYSIAFKEQITRKAGFVQESRARVLRITPIETKGILDGPF